MVVPSRLTSRVRPVNKVFGNAEPAAIQAGEAAAGMTPARPFSPGEPIGPYDGYSRNPRTRDFVTGYNIAARPRSQERVPFSTLKGLIDAYDVAQMAIWHRIDSIRSLEWSLVAADGFEGDVADAVAVGMGALKSPDRENEFSTWLASYLYDVLAYDAGTLYRIRNRVGQVVGLRAVDGTTVAPLLDYWGNVPAAPAEAYVQYVNGLPWNWLTTNDLIYKPFRKVSGSPYGKAPLEAILLNANTDLRFQAFFLQRFTEGNIPAAFASAPETWSPQQIEQFQTYWDAFILGDQAAKSQIKWIPAGSKIEFTSEREFSDAFSLFLMRKTLASYHVVPSDLGFTETVNKSSGETQSDVQHRVGDVPLAKHISAIITGFLQNDLHLPLKHQFDFGEEQDDRLQTAQADKIYWEIGAVGASELRQLRFGLTEADGYVTPRSVFTTRGGPIPLGAIDDVAGEIDPATGAPARNAIRSQQVFRPVQGVIPVPPIENVPLAVQEFGPSALPPAPTPVGKEGATAGITASTGIYSYDGPGKKPTAMPDDEDEDGQDDVQQNFVAKASDAEIAAFRRYAKQTRRPGRKWRDFQFTNLVDPTAAHRLNDGGRFAWRKAAGQVAVAGLAVRAQDTGRVLMLQRALDDSDPAAGYFEFPGGHLEGDETPAQAAAREWSEETGLELPEGLSAGTWTSANGVYQGFVYSIGSEDILDIFDRDWTSNPDDPDGDQVEAIAWWDPAQLADNPAVRPELLGDIDAVLAALDAPVAKAGAGPDPKAGDRADHWPGWDHDQDTANHWSLIIAGALAGVLTALGARVIAAGFLATRPDEGPDADRKALIAEALAYLAMQRLDLAGPLVEPIAGARTDGMLIGSASGQAVVDGERPDLGSWKPGDTGTAETLLAERGYVAERDTVVGSAADTAAQVAETRLSDAARALADSAIAGADADEAGQAIRNALADASRADAVAITEVTDASGIGALAAYQRNGIAKARWITEQDRRVCPRCQANEAAGPIPIGQAFPSGASSPPQHARCRCGLLPSSSTT